MRAEYRTLTANTVATVTITQPASPDPDDEDNQVFNIYAPGTLKPFYGKYKSVEVTVLAGTTPVFVLAGESGSVANPTVLGDDLPVLAGAPGASLVLPVDPASDIDVKLISSGTPTVGLRFR